MVRLGSGHVKGYKPPDFAEVAGALRDNHVGAGPLRGLAWGLADSARAPSWAPPDAAPPHCLLASTLNP
jgi:hypothetical protein